MTNRKKVLCILQDPTKGLGERWENDTTAMSLGCVLTCSQSKVAPRKRSHIFQVGCRVDITEDVIKTLRTYFDSSMAPLTYYHKMFATSYLRFHISGGLCSYHIVKVVPIRII